MKRSTTGRNREFCGRHLIQCLVDCLWLHGILARIKTSARAGCTTQNAVPERAIDFGKVTAEKKFFSAGQCCKRGAVISRVTLPWQSNAVRCSPFAPRRNKPGSALTYRRDAGFLCELWLAGRGEQIPRSLGDLVMTIGAIRGRGNWSRRSLLRQKANGEKRTASNPVATRLRWPLYSLFVLLIFCR